MPEPSLHHVGYVVRSISQSLEQWQRSLMAVSASKPFEDEIQQAKVLFLEFANGSTTVELVEPLTSSSPLMNFLEKGGGLHHLCFEVDNLDEHLQTMKTRQALLIRRPQPAIAFDGRQIAWMMTKEKLLVEYLERKSL